MELYGHKLYMYLLELQSVGKIKKIEADVIYLLSIDWPYDYQIKLN
jgi:hypothetical protein